MSSDFSELITIQLSEESQPRDFLFVGKLDLYRWVNQFFLVGCLSIILAVSAIDTWLATINAQILHQEANPICEWLIRLAPESHSCFIVGKACGAIMVTSILFGLAWAKYQHARLVILTVTFFQVGLLAYLWLSDPRVDGWINFSALFDDREPSIVRLMFFVAESR